MLNDKQLWSGGNNLTLEDLKNYVANFPVKASAKDADGTSAKDALAWFSDHKDEFYRMRSNLTGSQDNPKFNKENLQVYIRDRTETGKYIKGQITTSDGKVFDRPEYAASFLSRSNALPKNFNYDELKNLAGQQKVTDKVSQSDINAAIKLVSYFESEDQTPHYKKIHDANFHKVFDNNENGTDTKKSLRDAFYPPSGTPIPTTSTTDASTSKNDASTSTTTDASTSDNPTSQPMDCTNGIEAATIFKKCLPKDIGKVWTLDKVKTYIDDIADKNSKDNLTKAVKYFTENGGQFKKMETYKGVSDESFNKTNLETYIKARKDEASASTSTSGSTTKYKNLDGTPSEPMTCNSNIDAAKIFEKLLPKDKNQLWTLTDVKNHIDRQADPTLRENLLKACNYFLDNKNEFKMMEIYNGENDGVFNEDNLKKYIANPNWYTEEQQKIKEEQQKINASHSRGQS